MNLPNDPVILLSFVNTQLRDNYSTLDALCEAYAVDKKELADKLAKINYFYDEKQNSFV